MKRCNTRILSKGTEHGSQKLRLGGKTAVVAALICVLCAVLFLFARSYSMLHKAILQERIDYVEEISSQIMTSQLFMEHEYSDEARNLAHVLDRGTVNRLDDIHQYVVSKDRGEILLMSEKSEIVDLSGKHISMPNDALTQKMLGETGVTSLFTSLNYADDRWLFVAPIAPRMIEGTVYTAVILSVSADEFRDNMTISLLDDRGASYIVGNNGHIKVKPLDDSLAFNGYNLLSSMASQGVPEEDIEKLRNDLSLKARGSIVIQAGDIDWLVGHSAIDDDTSIVVAIPLTLTAAQTYRGLSGTIILASLSIIIIALIALMLILEFLSRDRAREKEALAVAAKSDFYSKMSHDIRTPLNAVIGLVQLANDDTDDPTIKAYLAQSLSSAHYLLGIINDVLEMNRIESGNLPINESPFDMNALLDNVKAVAAPLLAQKDLVFIDEATERFPIEYISDPVHIKQILTNLISNAAKFTKPGGQVGLRVTSVSREDGYDEITMVVSDTGIGMSEAFLDRIFLPFEQESSSYIQQYAGSGLGLTIVHDLVKRMRGTIDVSSKLGEGSTFTVTLPVLRGEEIKRADRPKKPDIETFSGRRVLLVEDNAINQMVAVKILSSKFAIQADVASDGAIALDMFSNSAVDAYDMILMDIKMPNMDGLTAARAIRALPRADAKRIPIVALSANTYREDADLSLAAGMNGHLTKPLDIDALGDVFHRFFQDR